MTTLAEPTPALTRSQINKLGERLRKCEEPTDEDLELLAAYQRSLQPLLLETLAHVGDAFARALPDQGVEATIRTKQLRSIVAKLRRESTRLSSMQDLVGFRVVVPKITDQDKLIAHIPGGEGWKTMDRRQRPSYGYRAVHVIRTGERGAVEVQVRTYLQHQWAELT